MEDGDQLKRIIFKLSHQFVTSRECSSLN